MNDRRIEQIFDAARNETPPQVPEQFESRVMRAIHEALNRRQADSGSIFDQLNLLFPRLAWAAVFVIALSVAGDLTSSALNLPTVTEGVAQLADQWLLNPGGF